MKTRYVLPRMWLLASAALALLLTLGVAACGSGATKTTQT